MDELYLVVQDAHTCALEFYIEVAGEAIDTIESIFYTQSIQTYGEQCW